LFRRSYFMAKWQESDDSDQYLKTKAINGLSNVIHEIWDESTVESPGFILKDDTVLDYLRFFCWATEGNEGPFGLPDTVFDLPLKSVPEEQKQSIKDLRF